MEWHEFLGELSLPGRSQMRLKLNQTHMPFTPSYVWWLRGWSNRRSTRKQVVHDNRMIRALLSELCPGRWVLIGYSVIVFEHRSDAALAKLGWPTELL